MAQETIKKVGMKAGSAGHRPKAGQCSAETNSNMEAIVTQENDGPESPAATVPQLDASISSGGVRPKPEGGWRATVGMFTGDADMLAISEATRKIRERNPAA